MATGFFGRLRPPLFCLAAIVLTSCASHRHTDAPDSDEWLARLDDGCSLYVHEIGAGPRVVVLHGGWGAEHGYMIDGLLPLADRYRFVFYDQRGSLRSRCDTSSISVDRHVEDLEALRKKLGEERMVLVAHSMGGYLAMAYAQRYPDRVAGLVLIGSAPARGTVTELTEDITGPALKRWDRPEVGEELAEAGISRELSMVINPLTHTEQSGLQATDEQRRLWHRITFAAINLHDVRRWRRFQGAHLYSADAGAAAARSMPESWDFTPALNRLAFPILVLHGDDDYIPAAFDERWIGDVPEARLQIVHDAGHVVWIDQPETFVEAIGSYLAGPSRR